MRDKFHFNLREDGWELKSKKGFLEKGDAEERAILNTERGWLEMRKKKKKTGAFSTHEESKWAGRQSAEKSGAADS